MSCGCGAPKKSSCCCPKPSGSGCCSGQLLCDNTPNNGVVPFIRIYQDDGCLTDLTIGGKPYAVMGMVGPCTEDQTDGCDTTTPVAVAHLCLADGTPLIVVVQRSCDGVVSAPGYVNLLTGVYTAGPVPADAAPCDTSVATARTDGRIIMCDCPPVGDCIGFLRAIAADGTITDTTTAGAPYVPTGTVGTCESVTANTVNDIADDITPCPSPTTPISTIGLCLADGTPIAVIASRDCQGTITRDGWMNLATGAYTPGTVPAGTQVCGDTSPSDIAGILCDLDPDTGTVLGVLLVDVARDGAGVITGTQLINAVTGAPYVLAGQLAACPDKTERDLIVLCDTTPTGVVTAFVRDYQRDTAGTIVGFTDRTLTGLPYTPTGAVGVCDLVEECASPTTPVTTTGACLPDGTPIATVATRDCDGVVTQTGWLNLRTGAFTTGAPPAGTVACGTSQILMSGTMCDTDPGTGEVHALVSVEYHYDETGAIESARMVRAADGTTYALQGDLTHCPSSCQDCVTETLCDQPSTAAEPTVQQYAVLGGTLTNGVTFAASDAANSVFMQDQWVWRENGYLTFDRPVLVLFDVRVFGDVDARVILPAGVELVTLSPDHTWNPATRHLGPVSAATPQTAVSTFRMVATTGFTIGRIGNAVAARVGNLQVLALHPTPFLRTICRDCDGTVTSTVDTEMDGQTPYTVTGAAGACQPVADGDAPCCPEPVCYAGSTAGDACAAGVLQELPTIDPTITSATVEANPNGLTVTSLGSSHNGTTTGDWTLVGVDGTGAATGLVLRYNFGSPGDIAQIVLWNNFGSILDDLDGIGTATLTVYDAADTVLFTGPLNAGNGAPPFSTAFGGLLEGAAYFTLSDIVRIAGSGVTTIGWREIRGVGSYRALITWECPDETISALVEGPLAGITYDGVNITQTNGPHTFTFSSSRGAFDATLETDNPAAWSTTEVSAANPVTVLSGNASLSVQVEPVSSLNISAGLLHPDGTVTDLNTGQVVTDPQLVPCVAPPAPDHIITGHILDLCEAGHSFLRHVRVTRDATVLVTDTEIDGRSPYVVVSEDAVTAGPCTRDRLGEVCAELGPLLTPSEAVGFSQAGDCWVTSADSPDLTYTGDIDSIEFSVVGGLAGGPSFRLVLNGSVDVLGSAFTPPIPMFPIAIDTYTGTATVGGITITAEIVDGALALANDFSGQFGLAGRMRFTFSPRVSSVQINTSWNNDPGLQLCDLVVLPSTMPNPQQLSAFRSGDGTVTYYEVDGEEVDEPVLLPCGACCNGVDASLSTGVRRLTGDTAVVDLKAEFPGLQSVTLTVLAGTVDVTMSDGTAVSVPALVSLSWSVADEDDSSLAAASFDGPPGADYLLTWTWKASAAG